MKHLKYIKEYFDTEELSNKHGNLDFRKLVRDESIPKNSLLDVIASQIKREIPYFKDWSATEFEGGINFVKSYDYFIDKDKSILAKLNMHIEIEEQDIIDKGRLESLFYTVTYDSAILLIEGEERPLDQYTKLFEDKYKGVSSVGDVDIKIDFKNNFGMKELTKFLIKNMIPQMEKTVDEFEKITKEKIGRRGDVNPPISSN